MSKDVAIRQGDVTLFPIKNLPASDLEEVNPDKGRTILAYGEVTGHAHAMDQLKTKQFKSSDNKEYIQVLEDTYLRHEEHNPLLIPAGFYEKRINREYQDQGMVRKVID